MIAQVTFFPINIIATFWLKQKLSKRTAPFLRIITFNTKKVKSIRRSTVKFKRVKRALQGDIQNLITPKLGYSSSGSQEAICGGAVVYWSEPLTLDQRVAGSIHVNAWHICPLVTHFIHIAALHPGGHFIKRFVSVFHWQICSQPIRCKDFSSLWQLSVKNTDKTLDEMPPRCINGYPVGCEGYVVYVICL